MKIKTEREQLQNAIADLQQLLSWQGHKVEKARKRLEIKRYWVFSFWIWNSESTLKFILDKEESIWNELKDYQTHLKLKL